MKLLIITNEESELRSLLQGAFEHCQVISIESAATWPLDDYDAFAILGGAEASAPVLLPPERGALDRQILKGKKVFAEYIRGIGQVSFLESVSTRFERPVLLNRCGIADKLREGTIFDEQSNNRLKVYKALNRTSPILQYVRTPEGFYAVNDTNSVQNAPSEYALWLDQENLMVCSFRMSNFSKARFAPHDAWSELICGIVRWLGGRMDASLPLTVLRSGYALYGPQELKDTLARAIDWFDRADMFIERGGAPYAVKEGLSASIHADGTHLFASEIRDDCVGECALMYYLAYRLTGDERMKNISDGLYRMPMDMQIKDDCPHKGMVRGSVTGWWNVSYQDDTARGFLLPLMWRMVLSGERDDLPAVCDALDYLVRTTGTDGLRAVRVDFYDQGSGEIQATGLHREFWSDRPGNIKWAWGGGISGDTTIEALASVPADVPSAHYNAFYLGALLMGYKLTGNLVYLKTGIKGMNALMKDYPVTAREHSETQELCRLVMPLAMLYWATGESTHKNWLYRVADDLQKFRRPSGAYIEWDTGYIATCAGVKDGESSVLSRNGDPVVDFLYSANWLPLGFAAAYFVSRDPHFRKLWQDISDYCASVQIKSENPLHDGVWPRALDDEHREVYGVPNDVGWGPWSVETGWTMAEIASGIMLGLLDPEPDI